MASYFSSDVCNFLKDAEIDLIASNATVLINYIYNHSHVPPYNSPELRVALSIRVLMKLPEATGLIGDQQHRLLLSIITDLQDMMADQQYLASFAENATNRKKALETELKFIHKLIHFDEDISLNTCK